MSCKNRFSKTFFVTLLIPVQNQYFTNIFERVVNNLLTSYQQSLDKLQCDSHSHILNAIDNNLPQKSKLSNQKAKKNAFFLKKFFCEQELIYHIIFLSTHRFKLCFFGVFKHYDTGIEK